MPLYHVRKGFPDIELPVGEFPLVYSNHALHQNNNRKLESRYRIALPKTIDTRKKGVNIIEIETKEYGISKLLYKIPIDNNRRLVLAVTPFGDSYLVKTVWMVRANESKSINLARYADPTKDRRFKAKDLF